MSIHRNKEGKFTALEKLVDSEITNIQKFLEQDSTAQSFDEFVKSFGEHPIFNLDDLKEMYEENKLALEIENEYNASLTPWTDEEEKSFDDDLRIAFDYKD